MVGTGGSRVRIPPPAGFGLGILQRRIRLTLMAFLSWEPCKSNCNGKNIVNAISWHWLSPKVMRLTIRRPTSGGEVEVPRKVERSSGIVFFLPFFPSFLQKQVIANCSSRWKLNLNLFVHDLVDKWLATINVAPSTYCNPERICIHMYREGSLLGNKHSLGWIPPGQRLPGLTMVVIDSVTSTSKLIYANWQ